MKGVILTAGNATRLKPLTFVTGKILVPIYNKPMIFYGVSLLIKCGITDIVIVCNKHDINLYRHVFDNKYAEYGLNISFVLQQKALGTAHALKYASDFVGGEDFVLLFGDNIFISNNMDKLLLDAIKHNTGLTLFAKEVKNPQSFGVLEFDKNNFITNMEEKPKNPKTNFASTGFYIFKGDAMEKLKKVKKSSRGEYELTDVILSYISEHRAKIKLLDNNCNWLDTGTFDSLLDCSNYVKEFEQKNGLFGCIELELYNKKLINKTQ